MEKEDETKALWQVARLSGQHSLRHYGINAVMGRFSMFCNACKGRDFVIEFSDTAWEFYVMCRLCGAEIIRIRRAS